MELLVALPLILIFGLFLTHRVAGPLVRIKRTLSQVGKGNFGEELEIKVRRGDELTELTTTVNQMLKSLRGRFS